MSLLRISLLHFAFVFTATAYAAPKKNCSEYLNNPTKLYPKLMRTKGTYEESRDEGARAFHRYTKFSKEIRKALPRNLVYNLLKSYEYTIHRAALLELIDTLKENKAENLDDLYDAFEYVLIDKVLESDIPDRIENFFESPSQQTLFKALGDKSLKEMQEYFYGKNPMRPSKDSLLGQYLAETGAATVIRTFPKTDESDEQGEPRLVVAISADTVEAYHRYFGKPEFLFHYHTPKQDTLLLGQAGIKGTYAYLKDELPTTFSRTGSVVPHILLKTTEAGRARNFFRLASRDRFNDIALMPWLLDDYCAVGGYNSCTHWMANIPIGDQKVDSYTFPGKVDEWAENDVPKGPQTGELWEYSEKDANVRAVWQIPGHMQLWRVLGGLREAHLEGFMANPGYMLHVLTAWTKTDRVPVVFVVVKNHKRPLSDDFKLRNAPY